MPERYHIHVESAPPRFRPVGKLGIVDWREDCAGCHNCVKHGCIYGLYRDEAFSLHEERGFLDYIYQCKGCLNCIQNCTKSLLSRIENPEYERLGDDYYTPQIISVTWFQSETGRIPVSGAGYGGPFSGEGFDGMWTDMSEIVRPTRDGIHGREYISTLVDIGRKPMHLSFENGRQVTPSPPLLESPLPVIFDKIPSPWGTEKLYAAIVDAADGTDVWAVVPEQYLGAALHPREHKIIPLLTDSAAQGHAELIRGSKMVEIDDGEAVIERVAKLKSIKSDVIVGIRVEVASGCAERVAKLTEKGVEVIHLVFDKHGRERNGSKPRHARVVLREIHDRLIDAGTRDELTLISGGGVALAEHMAKAIICGTDLVGIDFPLLLALECRLCRRCVVDEDCPVKLQEVNRAHAARRITNLTAAWHLQLLELMGAMGIREVRRLRGETGRAMFYDELEREIFAPLFGKK